MIHGDTRENPHYQKYISTESSGWRDSIAGGSELGVDWIKDAEVGVYEKAIFPNEFIVQEYGASTVIWALNANEIPVDLRAVTVIAIFVSVARCKVKRAGNFFIEKDVAHRLQDFGIHSEGELADVAGVFIRVKDVIESILIAIAMSLYDFSIAEGKGNTVKGDALINGGSRVVKGTVHRISDGGGENLAIRDVHLASTRNSWHSFDREGQIGARADDVYAVSMHHAVSK